MKLFKNLRKRDNKGFSLIELIVVVLIMAIIAVALAPQVMKYVATSRVSADISTVDEAVSTAQIVMTNGDAYKTVKNATGKVYAIKITKSGAEIITATESAGTFTGDAVIAAGDKFYDAFVATLGASGKLNKVKLKTAAEGVLVVVTTSGVNAYEYYEGATAPSASTFKDADNDIDGGIELVKYVPVS